MKHYSSTCPFCETPAFFFYRDYESKKHFFCDKCKEFEISKLAEKVALTATKEWLATHSDNARNSPLGSFYFLSRPTNTSEVTSTVLEGKYIKKAP